MNSVLAATAEDVTLSAILVGSEEDQAPAEGFVINSLEKGLWAASKIARAQRNLEEIAQKAQYFHGLIDAWQEKSSGPYLSTIGYLSSLLRPFLTDRLIGVKSRSLILPGYRIGFRSTPSKVVIDEPEVALPYLEKAHPQAVQTKKEIIKSALKPLLAKGELIPGVTLSDGDEVLYVQEETR